MLTSREVIEKIVQDKTKKILDEKKLKPFRQPQVKITKYKKNEPVELNIKIDIQPQFKITAFFSNVHTSIILNKKSSNRVLVLYQNRIFC